MGWLVLVLFGPVLGWIAVQDFKERRISLLALILLFVLGTLYAGLWFEWQEVPVKILGNALFAIIILVSGTLLVKIGRSWESVPTFIGAGDFLFLLAISPMFSFGSFLVFLNTSIILTLILYGLLRLLRSIRQGETVPLAGALAVCLFCFICIDLWIPSDLLVYFEWVYKIVS